jgi:hypothetical protein
MRRARKEFAGETPDAATREFTAGKLWPLTGWKREERDLDPDVPRFLDAPDVPLPLFGAREVGGGDKQTATAFGVALKRRVDQIFDGWRLEYVGDEHNAKVYRLLRTPTTPPWVTASDRGDDAGGASDGD